MVSFHGWQRFQASFPNATYLRILQGTPNFAKIGKVPA